ncbi:hypothetical protein Tco_1062854, partial [Tanacetum coccineum]
VLERHIHALCNFHADVINPDNLLPLAYSFKDRVDPDVNDDTSEDEPTFSKEKWFSHLTVYNKLEASKGANWCLQTHVISDIKSSFKFSVLVNGITLKKLIRKGISSVLKPEVDSPGCNRVATDGTEIQYVGSIVIDLQVENLFLLQNMLNTVIRVNGSGHVDVSDRGSQFVICGDIKTVRTLV